MNNKGQSVLAEHVMIFFIVVAVLVAMTTYVRRSLQGRIHDARNFMIEAVNNNQVCDQDCLNATGGKVLYSYEPYYLQANAQVELAASTVKGTTSGNPKIIGAVYYNAINEQDSATTYGTQTPSECADGVNPKPAYCP